MSNLNEFKRSVMSHIQKRGADVIVIDIQELGAAQRAQIYQFFDSDSAFQTALTAMLNAGKRVVWIPPR